MMRHGVMGFAGAQPILRVFNHAPRIRRMTFADALAQWGVPKEVYLAALVDGCENTLAGSTPFWEGAVRVYADRACTQRSGTGLRSRWGIIEGGRSPGRRQ
jgi:hypothetical protein